MAESSSGAGPSPGLVVLIATYCSLLVIIHGAYAALGVKASVLLTKPTVACLFSRLSAFVFFAFGVTMLTLRL